MRVDDPYETVKTYGERNQYGSLPLGNVHDVAQFFSVSTHPTGVPGVGEVVFGHPSQLKIVARYVFIFSELFSQVFKNYHFCNICMWLKLIFFVFSLSKPIGINGV